MGGGVVSTIKWWWNLIDGLRSDVGVWICVGSGGIGVTWSKVVSLLVGEGDFEVESMDADVGGIEDSKWELGGVVELTRMSAFIGIANGWDPRM